LYERISKIGIPQSTPSYPPIPNRFPQAPNPRRNVDAQKQREALTIITSVPRGEYLYLLMYGGSQSAKTSFACYYIQLASGIYNNTTTIVCRNSFVNSKKYSN
jgi:hypothetical protein